MTTPTLSNKMPHYLFLDSTPNKTTAASAASSTLSEDSTPTQLFQSELTMKQLDQIRDARAIQARIEEGRARQSIANILAPLNPARNLF